MVSMQKGMEISAHDKQVAMELNRSQEWITTMIGEKNKKMDEYIKGDADRHVQVNRTIETFLKALYAELDVQILLNFDMETFLKLHDKLLVSFCLKYKYAWVEMIQGFVADLKRQFG